MHSPEIQLQIAAGEITLALSGITRALMDPTQADELPGRVMDLQDTTNQFLDLVATFKPAVYLCMRRQMRSLADLHVSEHAALAVDRAAT